MFTIVVGPFDSLSLYGVFETAEDAIETAERELRGYTWEVVPIEEI